MRMSQLYAPTLREDPSEADVVSQRLMLRAGYLRKLTAGIYTFLPLGLRVIQKIQSIIRDELDKIGCQEVLMPALQPANLWEETGRWGVYGKELMRLKDRHDREYCLGPTHEEIITDLVRHELKSYKQLPVTLYQIQTKYRDEIRPRFGIMRGREFLMKDAYSFHADEASLDTTYRAMSDAYVRIFERCGLRVRPIEADPGAIGGGYSQEFMVLADTGEEEVASCASCSFAAKPEEGKPAPDKCPSCGGKIVVERGIEVGHIFKLGTKYSESMKAHFVDATGAEKPFVMGCYGIGVGRTAAAAIEQHHDVDGIQWPMAIAPFAATVIVANAKQADQMAAGEKLYNDLAAAGIDAVLDDRDERAGVKFKDADLIGFPIKIIVGKTLADGKVEFKKRTEKEGALIPLAEVVSHVRRG